MANEKRLIDANALKKAILEEPWKDQPNMVRLTVDYINIIVDEQSTVDAMEVVHGRWIESEAMSPLTFKCSECKCWVVKHSINERNFRYCPNCGAKMDGDGNEN